MIVSSAHPVLVANADGRFVEQSHALPRREGAEEGLDLAQDGLLGMNGHYGACILEGAAHYHPESRLWQEQDHE